MPTASEFQSELVKVFRAAQEEGLTHIDVKARDLHNQVGGYPGSDHRMPVCCNIMRQNMKTGDLVLYEPPSGQGATLRIRYRLPR